MKMENGSSSTSSVVPYTNGTGAATIGPNKPLATGGSSSSQMANAVSMESLDSAISTTNGGGSGSDPQAQVRTLFVSGLPMDVKARELYLLFRAYPGYETSQLKLTPSSKNGASKMTSTPVGFVTFATRQDADEARKKLQGVRFDPEQTQTIRLELARSNTKVTKPSKQASPPNHVVNAAVATANSSVMPALFPPPTPIFSNIAVAQQLAAIQQQQQLAAAVLLNQQHHDPSSSNGSTALAQQQHQLLAALDQQQRHLSPLIHQNGIGDSSAIQHQLTALAALSHAQQAQTIQQLLQHQHQQQNSTAATILGPVGAGAIPPTNTANPQLAAVAALAAAQNHNQLVSTSSTALASGYPVGVGGTIVGGWQPAAGAAMNGQTTAPCSTIFIANLGPAAMNSPQIVEEELKNLFGMFQGFSRLRMHTKSGAPVAFIEYAEVAQAVGAMMAMQGYCLAANGGNGSVGAATNGIRIEFAKTRMGDTSSTAQQRTDGGVK